VQGELATVDLVAGAILALAILRGLLLGLIREVVSVASLVAASFAVRAFTPELAAWMQQRWPALPDAATPWLAGAALALGTLTAGAVLGRLLRRGARMAWLGMPDRLGGALLGAAEGVLVCALGLLALGALIGRDHRLLVGSRSIAALERLEQLAAGVRPQGVDVAAPPPKLERERRR
jgi:uncharacterized membrane protein required for colicin V production